MEPRIQYAKTADGVSIAFWTLGEGMPLVIMPPSVLASHVQLEWQWPEWRRWYEGLARRRKVVRYDGRGGGLSDRDVADFSLEARVLDLEAVVDRLGLERFVLLAAGTVGPTAIAYAVRHPPRVSHLLLWCAYARLLDIAAAVRAAQSVDVVVLCLGEGSYCETPGNITDLNLGEPQIKLAEAIQATGKPVVLVLVEGRPRIINRIADGAKAILMAYNPSNEGGTAVADVLFGDINPSGKLPFTYPRTPNGLINYDHKSFETENTAFGNMAFKPQFQFGEGLSYTTFTYSDLRLGKQNISASEELPVSVTVTNSGRRAGKEVVLLYVSDLVASLAPPNKRLRRFAKIHLEPGQNRTLTFKLRGDDLSFIGANNKPVIEPGEFDVTVGGLTQRYTLK